MHHHVDALAERHRMVEAGQQLAALVGEDAHRLRPRMGRHRAFEDVGGGDELGDEAGARPTVELRRRPDLHRLPRLHHHDTVAELHRLGLVVGDIDAGETGAPLQRLELDAEPLAELEVEIGERLVEEQEGGVVDQGAGQRHPLHLATGELGRRARGLARETHQLQHLADLGGDLCGAQAPDAKRERHVLEHASCAARSRRTGTPCRCRGARAARRGGPPARRRACRRWRWCRRPASRGRR